MVMLMTGEANKEPAVRHSVRGLTFSRYESKDFASASPSVLQPSHSHELYLRHGPRWFVKNSVGT